MSAFLENDMKTKNRDPGSTLSQTSMEFPKKRLSKVSCPCHSSMRLYLGLQQCAQLVFAHVTLQRA